MERVTFENGVHDITIENYHASNGISRSMLMDFKRSPLHFWHNHLNPDKQPKESTAAMNFGNLVHTMILEENKVNDYFVIQPKFDRRTRDGKQASMIFESTLCGRSIISPDDYAKAHAMRDRFYSLSDCSELIRHCKMEQSIYFTDKDTGLQLKVRPDAWNGGLVIDLKTSMNVKPRQFQAASYQYGYFMQAAMIADALVSLGIDSGKFVFAAIEKEPPYLIGLYFLDEDAIERGRQEYKALLIKLAARLEAGGWNSLIIENLSYPGFADYEYTEDYEHE